MILALLQGIFFFFKNGLFFLYPKKEGKKKMLWKVIFFAIVLYLLYVLFISWGVKTRDWFVVKIFC